MNFSIGVACENPKGIKPAVIAALKQNKVRRIRRIWVVPRKLSVPLQKLFCTLQWDGFYLRKCKRRGLAENLKNEGSYIRNEGFQRD